MLSQFRQRKHFLVVGEKNMIFKFTANWLFNGRQMTRIILIFTDFFYLCLSAKSVLSLCCKIWIIKCLIIILFLPLPSFLFSTRTSARGTAHDIEAIIWTSVRFIFAISVLVAHFGRTIFVQILNYFRISDGLKTITACGCAMRNIKNDDKTKKDKYFGK